jgi:hypothetical protein
MHLEQEDVPWGFVNCDDAGLVEEQEGQTVDQIGAEEEQIEQIEAEEWEQ